MGHKNLIRTGFRYTDEDFEDWFNDKNTDKFLDHFASYIGWIIISLNQVEEVISFCIQELMSNSESGDELIGIFQSELSYSNKVNALSRLISWHIKYIIKPKKQKTYLDELKDVRMLLVEAAEIRNQYAHANWHDISKNRFVRTKTKALDDGVYHWFRKFSIEEMKRDIKKIEKALTKLDRYFEKLNKEMHKSS